MTATRRQIASVVDFPKSPEPAESPNIIASLRQCVVEIEAVLTKLSFGGLSDGERAGHHDMVTASMTTPSLANSEFTVYHTLGRRPVGRFVVHQDNVGILYDVAHKWTAEKAIFKCNRANQAFKVILF